MENQNILMQLLKIDMILLKNYAKNIFKPF